MCFGRDLNQVEAARSDEVPVIEHRVEGERGREGRWHQELAFTDEVTRDAFVEFLAAHPELRPANSEFRLTYVRRRDVSDEAALHGLLAATLVR